MGNGHKGSAGSKVSETASGAVAEPTPGGRRERRAVETRMRLFRSALRLFAERGFSNVTVEDITEAADVGKGTFFNYFESKDRVLGVMAEIQFSRVKDAVAHLESGKQSVRSVLHRMALALAEEPGRSPELARALISSFLASEVVRGLINERIGEGRKVIARCVEEGQRKGEIDPSLQSEEVALMFQQAEMGTIIVWSLQGEPSLSSRIEASFNHFWRAIAAKQQEPEL